MCVWADRPPLASAFSAVFGRPLDVIRRRIDPAVHELPMDRAHRGEEQLVVADDVESVLDETPCPLEPVGGEPPELLPRAHVALVRPDIGDRPIAQAAILIRSFQSVDTGDVRMIEDGEYSASR